MSRLKMSSRKVMDLEGYKLRNRRAERRGMNLST